MTGYITTQQAAAQLPGMDRNKITQLIRRGELKAYPKYPGRKRKTYLIPEDAIQRYLEQNAAA